MQRESSKDTQIQKEDINPKVSPLAYENRVPGSWESMCRSMYHYVLHICLSMLFLQFSVLAVAGTGHGTRWLCAMTQEGHSCILVIFCKSSEETEAWKQKNSGSLIMSKMHPYSSISHLLPEDVIWKLAKEIGIPESELNAGLASGKLYHVATWMLNTGQKIQTSVTEDTEGMLISVVMQSVCCMLY